MGISIDHEARETIDVDLGSPTGGFEGRFPKFSGSCESRKSRLRKTKKPGEDGMGRLFAWFKRLPFNFWHRSS